MAVVRFYLGRPLKRMREVAGGIELVFYARRAGAPGPKKIVSQSDWDRSGEKRFVMDEEATPDRLRKLSADVPP